MKKARTRALLPILGALTVITPFSIDMYLPAFGQVATEFGTTVPRVSLSLASYFIGLAVGQMFYGPFLDRFGRKRPLYFGLALYLLATLACISSRSVEMLITARFFQALGGCAAGVGSTAMVADFYAPEERARVFSRLMLILSVSPFFAPTLGGVITGQYGWRFVFVALGATTLVVLGFVREFLPEGHPPDARVSLRLGPILHDFREILRDPTFFAYAVAGSFSFAGLFAYLAGAPALMMGTYGLTENQFGLMFAVLSVGVVGGAQVSIWLSRKLTPAQIFRGALRIQVALALIIFLTAVTVGLTLVPGLCLIFLFLSCIGISFPNAAALGLAPFNANAGRAAALLGFLQMGLGALGSAAFGLFHTEPAVALGSLFVLSSAMAVMIYAKATEKKKGPEQSSEPSINF